MDTVRTNHSLIIYYNAREYNEFPRCENDYCLELMEFFETSKLTTSFKTSDDHVVVRLEHVDLADETRVEIFNVLIRRIYSRQLYSQLSGPRLLSVVDKLSLDVHRHL